MSNYAPDKPGSEPDTEDSKRAIAEKALKCFRRASEAWQKQRQRERDDLRFQVPDMQWDELAKRQRLGTAVDGVPTPARPVLSIPKLDQPISLVRGQMRQAALGIQVHPLSEESEDDTAEILQGVIRQIGRDSNATMARAWGFDRAIMCGLGWYRVNTCYDEYGQKGDQKIVIERILNQDSVFMDPSAGKEDFSDAKWAFATNWVPLERFEALYPDAETIGSDNLTFADLERETPEWVQSDGTEQACLVAEYWYKEREDGDGPEEWKLMYCKLAAGGEPLQFLDGPREVNGRWIPLIPVIGRELIPFDQERRWTGMIGPAKDAQRAFDYGFSTAVEIAALEPKAPFIGAEGQFEGHESEWQQANIRNWPYLEYKPISLDGTQAPPPARAQIDANRLSVAMQIVQISDQAIQSATSVYDPSLGRLTQKERSGKAILASQSQSDAATSGYLQNLGDISMTYEAKVILDLIPAIYDRPGRIVRMLDQEGEKSSPVMLNQPHYIHPQTQRPVPMNGGRPPVHPMTGQPVPVKNYDLSKGRWGVSVTIGKTQQTRMQAGAEAWTQLLPNLPPEAQVLLLPTFLRFQDVPGAKEAAEMLGKYRDAKFPGLSGDQDQPDPKQMQAQLQGMGQQLQLTHAQLQQAIQEIKTDQAKQQATLAKAQIDAQAMLHKAEMDNAARVEVARISAARGSLDQAAAAKEEYLSTGLTIAHEGEQAALDRAHEVGMAAMGQAHARQQAAMAAQQDQASQQSDQAHQAGMAAAGAGADAQSQASDQAAQAQQQAADQAAQQAQPTGGAE